LKHLTPVQRQQVVERLRLRQNGWKPFPGPQTEAYLSQADILLYGGAAGGGKTDLLLGVMYHEAVSQNVRAFVNGQFQTAVAERLNAAGSDFRPGNQSALTLGLRYEASQDLVPQLQVNLTHKCADQGALADTADTAGTVAYLSPGIIGKVGAGLQAYAFVQVPIFSNLSGYQLFPHWTGTLGLAYKF